MAKRKGTGAIMCPDKAPIDGGLYTHYGYKPMESWASVLIGPLARHIDGEVAEAYGNVRCEVWVDMVYEALAAKLDGAGDE